MTGQKWDKGRRGSRNGPEATATKRGVTPGREPGGHLTKAEATRRGSGSADQKKPMAPSAYDTSKFFVCW